MKSSRVLSLILGVLVGVCLMSGDAGAWTHTYTFVAGESSVTQTGGFAGIHEVHRLTGQFGLSFESGSVGGGSGGSDGGGIASFDWVEATMTDSHLFTTSLGELFRMTELDGRKIDDGTLEFRLISPEGQVSIELTVKLDGDMASISGIRYEPLVADSFMYELDAVATRIPNAGGYEYSDDFSTDKAKDDSYSHSVFWPVDAYGPEEPYLVYNKQVGNPAPSLIFMGYGEKPAELKYRFPLNSVNKASELKGTISFEKCDGPWRVMYMPEPVGYLRYSVSGDGQQWSEPRRAERGVNTVGVSSGQGTCYISFEGAFAVIDNLKVELRASVGTIRVPRDYKTIQGAINAASDGDVVEVMPLADGMPYTGDGNWDIDFLGKAITVKGVGAEGVVIDCFDPRDVDEAAHRGFYFHNNEGSESVLKNFTIINGEIGGSTIPSSGDVWHKSAKHPVGGGIYCEMASPTIINCSILNCRTEVGGGIGCVGSSASIVDCRIQGCEAGGYGGSRSGGKGGGIGLLSKSDVSIINCIVWENSGYYNSFGGGIYGRWSSARIVGCDISFNWADGNIDGGGVYFVGGGMNLVLHNNVISNNSASAGSGVYLKRGAIVHEGEAEDVAVVGMVTIKNCTIAHNRITSTMLPLPAGGILVEGAGVSISNCIVWYNDGPEILMGSDVTTSSVRYSNVEDKILGPGNISKVPLFAPTGVPDYHLQSMTGRFFPGTGDWFVDDEHSPCIDAGDPDDAYGAEPKPNGGRVNMGAYGNTHEASKGRGHLVYHVDIVNGDDGNNGLSRKTAFGRIGKGIGTAVTGDTVLVWPGVYRESLNFRGKGITVQSAADAAVIEAPYYDAVTFHTGEGPKSVLRNFVIRGSAMAVSLNYHSNPTLTQLTIVGNDFGIAAYEDSNPNITNCIFDRNQGDLFGCEAKYSIFTSMILAPYVPLFADYANGDYHLLSRLGRYDAVGGNWVRDKVDSIALDAGNPRIRPANEPMPNGGYLNAGAYGGTAYASKSAWPLGSDGNFDGIVNFVDFGGMATGWLDEFGIFDLVLMADEWLESLKWVNRKPHISIVRPYDMDMIGNAHETIVVRADAWDPDGSIVKVEFFANNAKIGEDIDGSDGWSVEWWSYSVGGYNLTAKATDDSGGVKWSHEVHISVVGANKL